MSDKLREALKFARESIWSGCDAISALVKIDTALAQPQNDAEASMLKAMEQECWTLRCVDIPTGCGDADVGWEVIQHYQSEPHDRMVAHGKTPQEALRNALAPKCPNCNDANEYGDYEGPTCDVCGGTGRVALAPLSPAPPSPERMRGALEYIVSQQWDENADLDDICQTAEKALSKSESRS